MMSLWLIAYVRELVEPGEEVVEYPDQLLRFAGRRKGWKIRQSSSD